MGLEPLVAPLLTVEPIVAEIDMSGVGALAFTSANGVRAFAERRDCLEACRDFVVFVVGAATAEAARAAGFPEVRSADGDVEALAAIIARERPGGLVLCPGAEQRAGDLVGELSRAGVEVRAVAVYRTVPTPGPKHRELEEVAAILIHSPRAASVLATLGLDLSGMTVVGLSSACLKPLARTPVRRWVVAERPTEDALLEALSLALGISPAQR